MRAELKVRTFQTGKEESTNSWAMVQLKLEIVNSLVIQRKKPCPKMAWLRLRNDGGAADSIFLLDKNKISQLSLNNGKIKHSFPSLSNIQAQLCLTASSASGSVLAGLTLSGEMFVWHQPSQLLSIYTSPLCGQKNRFQDCRLFPSDSGEQVLLVCNELEFHLWELKDGNCPQWWKLPVPEELILPSGYGAKEAAIDTCFFVHQTLGECCQFSILSSKHETKETVIFHCLLTWKGVSTGISVAQRDLGTTEGKYNLSTQQSCADMLQNRQTPPHSATTSTLSTVDLPVNVTWKSCTFQREQCCGTPQGRGCYVIKISPTASVTAVAINHTKASDTHVSFVDLLNEVGLSYALYMIRDDTMSGRTFWITSMVWTADGLLLVCMTRRGCLAVLPRFGPPLMLITSGCNMDMGPSEIITLHPLVIALDKSLNITDHETSQSSERDALRQRFSVTAHPHLPLVLCSDGYCITVLSFESACQSLPSLVLGLVKDCQELLHLPQLQPLKDTGLTTLDSHSASKSIPSGEKNHLKHKISNTPPVKRRGLRFIFTSSSATTGPVTSEKARENKSHNVEYSQDTNLSTMDHKYEMGKAYIFSAWGLVLSANKYEPGNGLCSWGSEVVQNKTALLSMKIAEDATIATLVGLSFLPISSTKHPQQSSNISLALSLANLDRINRGRHRVFYSLANSMLIVGISQLLQVHKEFTGCSNHTVNAVEIYIKTIKKRLRNIWKMFIKLVIFASELYGQDVIAKEVYSDPQKPFSIPLFFFQKVCTLLLCDLNSCSLFSEHAMTLSYASTKLGGKERSVLQHSVMKQVSKLAALLQFANFNLKTSFHCHNLNKIAIISHHALDNEASPKDSSHTQLNILFCFLKLLQTYKLKQTLDLAHSFLVWDDSTVNVDHNHHMSVSGLILSSPSSFCSKSMSKSSICIMLLTLARVMAAFFCNSKASVVRSCYTFRLDPGLESQFHPQYFKLKHESLVSAIQEQGLSDQWTATHSVELFMLSGCWYEAAAFAAKLGNWEKSLLLCIAYMEHTKQLDGGTNIASLIASSEFCKVQKLSHHLAVKKINQAISPSSKTHNTELSNKTLPLISNILWACSCGNLDTIGADAVFLSLSKIWTIVGVLPALVPPAVYLPAPPLYCHQPKSEPSIPHSEDQSIRERIAHHIWAYSAVLKALNLLEICHKCYCNELVALHRKCGASATHNFSYLPNMDGSITGVQIPLSLVERAKGLMLQDTPNLVKFALATFREFCGLLWLLHVRDKTSEYLRRVHHNHLLNETQVQVATDAIKQCVLWCARLLPFRNCLQSQNASEIEDILLSTISELPCDSFMATILSQCFPRAQIEGNHCLTLKMGRLLTRMRSTVVEKHSTGTSQPLSVEYQMRSQSILNSQMSLMDKYFIPQCSQSQGNEVFLSDEALIVGSHTFEYDQAYLEFLDTVFSVTNATDSVPQAQMKSTQLHQYLKYSAMKNTFCALDTASCTSLATGGDTCWENILPLVISLYRWSQTVNSNTNSPSQLVHRKKQGPKQIIRAIDPSTMKIDLSFSFLAYCLQLEEEKSQVAATMTAYNGGLASPITNSLAIDSLTTITADTMSNSSSICEDDLHFPSDSTLCEENLNNSSATKLQPSLPEATHQTKAEISLSKQMSFPLLLIPDHESTKAVSVATPELVVKPPQKKNFSITDSAEAVIAKQSGNNPALVISSSVLEFSSSDIALSGSQSTGDLSSSQVTFSIGEFVSETNHKIVSKVSAQLQATMQEADGLSSLEGSIELKTIENTKINTCKIKIYENDKTFDHNAVLLSRDTSPIADSTQNSQSIECTDTSSGGKMNEEEEQKEDKRKEKEENGIDLDLHVGSVGGVRGHSNKGGTVIMSEDYDARDKKNERASGEGSEGSIGGQRKNERLVSKRTEERVTKDRTKGRVNKKRKQKRGGKRNEDIAGEGRSGKDKEIERGREKRWEDKEEESREEERIVKISVEYKDRRKIDEENVSQKSCEKSEKQFQEKDPVWLGEREGLVSIHYNDDDKEESRNAQVEEDSESHVKSASTDSGTNGTVEHCSTEEIELPSSSVASIPPPESGRPSAPHQERKDFALKLPHENSNSAEDISHGSSERLLTVQEPLLPRNNALQEETSETQDRNKDKILRLKMKKILQVQHTQLLNLLESTSSETAEVSVQNDSPSILQHSLKRKDVTNPNAPCKQLPLTTENHCSSSEDLSIKGLCCEESTITVRTFPLLTINPSTKKGDEPIFWSPQSDTRDNEMEDSVHTNISTTLPLLHFDHNEINIFPQTTSVHNEADEYFRHGQYCTRTSDTNKLPILSIHQTNTHDTNPYLLPTISQPAIHKREFPLLECQQPSSRMPSMHLIQCHKKCTNATVMDHPVFLGRELSIPPPDTPLLIYSQGKMQSNLIQPPPTHIELPMLPVESRTGSHTPDSTQTELPKPTTLLQITYPTKDLKLPVHLTSSILTDKGGNAVAQAEETCSTQLSDSVGPGGSIGSAGENNATVRHHIEEDTGTRSQERIMFSFSTTPDELTRVTTNTHQGSPIADTGKQTITANLLEQQQEMHAFLAGTPTCTSLPPTEIPLSYQLPKMRQLEMNANDLPNENACSKERNQSSSTTCSSDVIVCEIYSETEEATHSQPSIQTPDKPSKSIFPTDPVSSKPRLFIEVTSIESEGSSILSSSDRKSTPSHSPVARSEKTLLDAQATDVHGKVSEGEIGTGNVRNGSVPKAEESDMCHRNHAETKKDSKINEQERTNKQLNCMDEEENKLKLESKRQGLNQLHQMEEQLSAIESTAKLVENELKASNKLLSTIDHLHTVVKATTAFEITHKSQGLSVKDINGGAPGGSALLNSNPEVGGNPVIECGQQYHQALAGKGSNLTNQVCNLLGNGETAFTAVAAQTIAHEHSADSGKLHTHWKDGSSYISQGRLSITSSPANESHSSDPARVKQIHCLNFRRCKLNVRAEISERRRVQEKRHKSKRFEDAFTLMEDILSSNSLKPTSKSKNKKDSGILQKSGSFSKAKMMPKGVKKITDMKHSFDYQPEIDLASADELTSMYSGSVASNIDWNEVENLLEN